jgi:hypothetical protein
MTSCGRLAIGLPLAHTMTSTNIHGPSVITYTAVVRLALEYSSLEANPAVPPDVRSAAIKRAPGWIPDGWPPQALPAGHEVEAYTLIKLRRLFDLGYSDGHPQAAEVRTLIGSTWLPIADRLAHGYDPTEYKAFKIRADVWTDGEASWEYSHDGSGAFPPGINTAVRDGFSELDSFLQLVVRADLQARLEALIPDRRLVG